MKTKLNAHHRSGYADPRVGVAYQRGGAMRMHMKRAASPDHRRISRTRLNGVSTARRKCVKPALRKTSVRRASPACAPSTWRPPSEIACAQHRVVEAE